MVRASAPVPSPAAGRSVESVIYGPWARRIAQFNVSCLRFCLHVLL